jgi:hypothetical protein
MKLIEEFKAFAVRGNIVDLAVAVIIGTAFGKITLITCRYGCYARCRTFSRGN